MDIAIPDELMPIIFPYRQNQIQQAYPLVHSYEPHFRDYLPATYFFNRSVLGSTHSRAVFKKQLS